MRNATQFALMLVASSLAAHGQHYRQVTISTGPSPRWIAVADVNHDRNPDIIVANAGSDTADSGSITLNIPIFARATVERWDRVQHWRVYRTRPL
jgi:hypothetical protein